MGRLSEEKGIRTLLAAWNKLGGNTRLKIAGAGPLAAEVEAAAQSVDKIEFVGHVSSGGAAQLLRDAHMLIIPSICYEGLPMVVVEALAAGVPIIASDLGALSTLVQHEHTGLHFRPGDAEDLLAQVEWLIAHEEARQRMRKAARAEFELHYTAERNHEILLTIYDQARQRRQLNP